MNEIFYRYVEAAELEDIRSYGALRAGRSSCGEGKWVARSEAHAAEWGRAMDTAQTGKVVRITVPRRAGRLSYPNLDSIGPAVYLEAYELPAARVEEV